MSDAASEKSRLALAALRGQMTRPDELWRRETYDVSLVQALQGPERAAFTEILGAAIDQGDALAALTAGQGQIAELTDALLRHRAAPGWFGLSVRRGLVALGAGRDVIDELCSDTRQSGAMHRFAAVVALGEIGAPLDAPRFEALLRAFADPDSTVSKAAYQELLRLLDLQRFARVPGTDTPELRAPLERRLLLTRSSLAALREVARAELYALFRAVFEGVSPDSLGLEFQPTVGREVFLRLGEALFDATRPIPLAELRALSGDERLYAEALLAKSLDRRWLPSVEALAELGARWVVPALRELAALDSQDEVVVAALRKALAFLDGA